MFLFMISFMNIINMFVIELILFLNFIQIFREVFLYLVVFQ